MKQYNKFSKFNAASVLLLIVLILILLVIYTYNNTAWPVFDGDESGLLFIPFNFDHFHSVTYNLGLSKAYLHFGLIRSYPPLNNDWLRVILNWLFGFSDHKNRVYSALMILSSWLVYTLTALRFSFSKKTWLLLLSSFFLIALTPGIVYSARFARFEEEVIFLGILGCYLPLLFCNQNKRAFYNKIIWCFSGAFLSWAGTSHPYGLVFCASQLLLILTNNKEWNAIDGIKFRKRIAYFFIGGMLVAIPAVIDLLYHYQARKYFLTHGYASWVMHMNMQRIITYTKYPMPSFFKHLFSSSTLAYIMQLNYFSLLPTYKQGFWLGNNIYYALFWLLLATSIFIVIKTFLKNTNRQYSLFIKSSSLTLILLALFTFFYYRSVDYYVYFAFFIPVNLITCLFFIPKMNANKILYYALIILAILYATMNCLNLYKSFKQSYMSIDDVYKVERHIRKTISPDSKGYIYTSSFTWRYASKQDMSILSLINRGALHAPISGVAFRSVEIPWFIDHAYSMTIPQTSHEAKIKNFYTALDKLEPAFIFSFSPIKNPKKKINTYFFYSNKSHLKLKYIQLSKNLVTQWEASKDIVGIHLGKKHFQFKLLSNGAYLILIPNKKDMKSAVQITNNKSATSSKPLSNQKYLPAIYILKLNAGSLDITQSNYIPKVYKLTKNFTKPISQLN